MKKTLISRFFISSFAIFILQVPVSAQSAAGLSPGLKYFMYGAVVFISLAFVLLAYFLSVNKKFEKAYSRKKGITDGHSGLVRWWNQLDKKFFTRAAPLEKEEDVLMDHDYDGIKELDNALPPWWKWGFYITLVLGVLYMFRFHVWKTGPSPEDEYNKEMTQAAAVLEKSRKNNKESVDEKTVTLADATGITAGKKIFTGTCIPCHGTLGEGNVVGPNLTDKYWIHGGSLGDIFKTINIGVPEKGMQAWGKIYSPAEIKNISSYIYSLQGTNPPNGKAPQGDLYTPGSVKDSTTLKKDTVQIK